MNKKAAMFGLDARIALAIFGALSVISGAALYSAIKLAHLEQAYQKILETGKAVEAFYLDTGVQPSKINGIAMSISEIITDKGIKNWNGPYINAKEISPFLIQVNGNPLFKFFLYMQSNTGLGGVNLANSNICTEISDCSYWLKAHVRTQADEKYPNAEAYVLSLDEKIDGGDGDDKGDFRINWYGPDKTDPIIFYKVMPAISL